MRLPLVALAALGLLATLPSTAAACPTVEECVPDEVEACSALLQACVRVDPDDLADPVDLRDLIGPCTCDPIE